MNLAPFELQERSQAELGERAVQSIARARAECLSLGLPPGELGRLLLEEATLAWMIAGYDEAEIRKHLDTAMDHAVKPWLARLRHRAGVCDCLAEVHFEALCEAAREQEFAG